MVEDAMIAYENDLDADYDGEERTSLVQNGQIFRKQGGGCTEPLPDSRRPQTTYLQRFPNRG